MTAAAGTPAITHKAGRDLAIGDVLYLSWWRQRGQRIIAFTPASPATCAIAGAGTRLAVLSPGPLGITIESRTYEVLA